MRRLLLAASAATLLAVGGTARAGVVDFDDVAVDFTPATTISDQGLDFNNISGSFLIVWDGTSPNSNGTNNLIFAGDATHVMSITRTGGGLFNLLSLDLSISWYDPNVIETVLINGNPFVISTNDTTFNLNLTNVSSVTISGVLEGDEGTYYWQADNVAFSAGAPEPATWAMMLTGFFGAGAALRARRKPLVA